MQTPKIGDVAFCSKDICGLITHIQNGVYHGVKISSQGMGEPWQSKTPRVACNFSALLAELYEDAILNELRKDPGTR